MNSKTYRVDDELVKDWRESMQVRVQKGLAKLKINDISDREATRLIRKTDGWKMAMEELRTKPKKENIFK